MPFVGDVVTMVGSKYNWETNPMAPLKLCLAIAAILLGCIVGRQVLHHLILRNCCKMEMFKEDQGTFMCMPIMVFFFVYLSSMIYNAACPDDQPHISGAMGITNRQFGKFAQCCTWLGDLLTIVFVWDSMFQDFTLYVFSTCFIEISKAKKKKERKKDR